MVPIGWAESVVMMACGPQACPLGTPSHGTDCEGFSLSKCQGVTGVLTGVHYDTVIITPELYPGTALRVPLHTGGQAPGWPGFSCPPLVPELRPWVARPCSSFMDWSGPWPSLAHLDWLGVLWCFWSFLWGVVHKASVIWALETVSSLRKNMLKGRSPKPHLHNPLVPTFSSVITNLGSSWFPGAVRENLVEKRGQEGRGQRKHELQSHLVGVYVPLRHHPCLGPWLAMLSGAGVMTDCPVPHGPFCDFLRPHCL